MHQKGYKQVTKIAGCELWLEIIKRHYTDRSFYIIGAKLEVNAEVVRKLRDDFPGINIVGARDGYLRTPEERQALIDDVVARRPDVVFVAMGSPTQEILMSEMLQRHKAIYQGLGGSYDVYTGRVRRAPRWFLDHNIEFVYRFIEQPKRFKREIIKLKFAWWLLWRRF
jgi:UDP-N-acetyl-D-mannosaminouronate:lipid I N-acetyl-D-mannosaminouronosyltransferase